MCVRTFLNTVLFGVGAVLWLVVTGLVAGPFLYLWPGKNGCNARRFVYIQAKGILFFMRLCSRSWRVERRPRPQGPCVVAANHASALDLYTVAAFGYDNVLYITKGWVFKLPFFGKVMRAAGYIDAETTPPQQMLDRCRQAVKDGCDIVLFPQGSRKNPLARFKSGAFYLAIELGLPVIPLAIGGTGKMLPSGSMWPRPADILLATLGAVYPADFTGPLDHLEMAREVKKRIMDYLQKEHML